MYVCMYVYPSHFNCVAAISVVSSRGRLLTTWYRSDQKAIERLCVCNTRNGAGSDHEAIDV